MRAGGRASRPPPDQASQTLTSLSIMANSPQQGYRMVTSHRVVCTPYCPGPCHESSLVPVVPCAPDSLRTYTHGASTLDGWIDPSRPSWSRQRTQARGSKLARPTAPPHGSLVQSVWTWPPEKVKWPSAMVAIDSIVCCLLLNCLSACHSILFCLCPYHHQQLDRTLLGTGCHSVGLIIIWPHSR